LPGVWPRRLRCVQNAFAAGSMDWPGIGRLEWTRAVALIDSILRIAWTRVDPELRRRCRVALERELGYERPLNGSCHDGMALAWGVLEEWPTRLEWVCRS
jgi:hypothetical protein